MKCPSCNKFAAQSADNEPEMDDLDLNVSYDAKKPEENGVQITGSVRIVVSSECCGDELKEATFEVDIDLTDDCKDHMGPGHDLSIRDQSASMLDEYESTKTKTLKSGKVVTRHIPPRYQTHYYGVDVEVDVVCTCDEGKGEERFKAHGAFSDKIPAGGMDELV